VKYLLYNFTRPIDGIRAIAGFLWDKIGPEATFLDGFVLTIISIFSFTFVKRAI